MDPMKYILHNIYILLTSKSNMVSSKKRIQVNISKQAETEIEELRKKLNLGSISDVIRSSLRLTNYLELEKEAGNEVIVRNKKTKKEKEIVFIK